MDQLPPVVTSPAENNTIPRVKVSRRPPRILLIITLLVGLLIVAVLALLFVRPGRPSKPSPISPPPSPTSSVSVSLTPAASEDPARLAPPRLPLNSLSGHMIVTAVDQKLWLIEFNPQGPKKSLLLDVGSHIIDMVISPNHQLLAFTFSDTPFSSASEFPRTGLKVLDLSTKIATEFVPLGDLQIRRPTWSLDSIYLAVWNNGKSAYLFDMTNKRRVKELTAGSPSVGQIVFIPGQTKYSYVTQGSLFEVPYTIDEPVKLVDGVSSVWNFPSNPPLPSAHIYPGRGNYLLFYNTRQQLVLYNRRDSSSQILSESNSTYPYGGVVAHDEAGKILIYYNLNKEIYTPGIDDNPLYFYDLTKNVGRPFFAIPKTRINLAQIYPDPNHSYLLIQDGGFRVFSLTSKMESDCAYTLLDNQVIPNPESLWSPNSKYILSTNTSQIADVFSCAITTQFDSVVPDLAVWIK